MTSGETIPPAGVPSTAAGDVRDAHACWWNALRNEDVAVLDTLLADDLTFHGPSGGTTTKAGYLDRLRSGRLAYDSIAAAEPLVRAHGVTAIVTGRADIILQSDGEPRTEGLYYTAVYGWTAPRWRMLAWQSTIRADAR
jgi:ketosteroid isomerase-like protein